MNVERCLYFFIKVFFFLCVSIAHAETTKPSANTDTKTKLSTLDQQNLESSLDKFSNVNQGLNSQKKTCEVNPNCMTVVQNWIDDDVNGTSYRNEGVTNKIGLWVLGNVPKERAASCSRALQDNSSTTASEMSDFYDQAFFKDKFKPGLMDQAKTCNTGTENKNKLITSKSYYAMARLEQASASIVDELAGIDESLPGMSTLYNVPCMDDFPQVAKKCDHYRKNCPNQTVQDQGKQWKEYVAQAEEAYKKIQELDKKIEEAEDKGYSRGGGPYFKVSKLDEQGNTIYETIDKKTYIGRLQQARALVVATHPQVDQEIFKSNIDDDVKFEEALKKQFTTNRKELSSTLKQVNQALNCIKTNSKEAACNPTEIGKIMNKLPEVPDPFSLTKKENYKDPRWKGSLSGIETHRCLSEATKDRNQTADVMGDTGINMGLTVVTLGAGAGVVAAKAGLTASRVAVIGRAGFAASAGVDAAWFAGSMKSAISICSDKHSTELNQVIQGAQVPDKQCPGPTSNLSMATKKIDSCAQALLMAGLDGLPLVSAGVMAKVINRTPDAKAAETAKEVTQVKTAAKADVKPEKVKTADAKDAKPKEPEEKPETPPETVEPSEATKTAKAATKQATAYHAYETATETAEKANGVKPHDASVATTQKKSQEKVNEIVKKENKSIDEIKKENFSLRNPERRAKIQKDFPNLTPVQVNKIVTQVHGQIGHERRMDLLKKAKEEGRSLSDDDLKYIAKEITQKDKDLRKMGIAAADRQALIRLGYAGEDMSLLEEILSRSAKATTSSSDEVASAVKQPARTSDSIRQDIKKAEAEYQQAANDINANPLDRVAAKEKVADLQKEMVQNEIKLNPNLMADVIANTRQTSSADDTARAVDAVSQAKNTDRIPISQAKSNQLTEGGQHSQMDVLLIENKPGSSLLFKGKDGSYQRGTVSGVDPDNADNLIFNLTDSVGKATKVSVPQTKVVMTAKEEMKAVQEMTDAARAKGKSVLDEVIQASGQRTMSGEEIAQQLAKEAGSNPYRKEIADLKAAYKEKKASDPAFFATEEGQNLQYNIHRLEYKTAPFDASEVRMFNALDEVPTDTLRLGAGEKKLIAELEAKIAAKSNGIISSSDSKLIQRLEEVKRRPEVNLSKRISSASERARRMGRADGSRMYDFSSYRVPNETRSAAVKAVGDSRDDKAALDIMERWFKKDPTEVKNFEVREKLDLDRFYNKFAGKNGEKLTELRQKNPQLAEYLDRLGIYREVDDLQQGRFQNLLTTNSSKPASGAAKAADTAKVADVLPSAKVESPAGSAVKLPRRPLPTVTKADYESPDNIKMVEDVRQYMEDTGKIAKGQQLTDAQKKALLQSHLVGAKEGKGWTKLCPKKENGCVPEHNFEDRDVSDKLRALKGEGKKKDKTELFDKEVREFALRTGKTGNRYNPNVATQAGRRMGDVTDQIQELSVKIGKNNDSQKSQRIARDKELERLQMQLNSKASYWGDQLEAVVRKSGTDEEALAKNLDEFFQKPDVVKHVDKTNLGNLQSANGELAKLKVEYNDLSQIRRPLREERQSFLNGTHQLQQDLSARVRYGGQTDNPEAHINAAKGEVERIKEEISAIKAVGKKPTPSGRVSLTLANPDRPRFTYGEKGLSADQQVELLEADLIDATQKVKLIEADIPRYKEAQAQAFRQSQVEKKAAEEAAAAAEAAKQQAAAVAKEAALKRIAEQEAVRQAAIQRSTASSNSPYGNLFNEKELVKAQELKATMQTRFETASTNYKNLQNSMQARQDTYTNLVLGQPVNFRNADGTTSLYTPPSGSIDTWPKEHQDFVRKLLPTDAERQKLTQDGANLDEMQKIIRSANTSAPDPRFINAVRREAGTPPK